MPLAQKWLAMKATDGIDRCMIVNQGFTVIAYIFKGKHGAKCWCLYRNWPWMFVPLSKWWSLLRGRLHEQGWLS